ncbi:MAG: hypothetical protein ACO1OB_08290 [Archangium sp.]
MPLLALLAACGPELPQRAVLVGHIDASTLHDARTFQTLADDGAGHSAAIDDGGGFELEVELQQAWSLRVARSDGTVVPIALARAGHFDRALMAQGRVTVALGEVWAPSTREVRRVFDRQPCVDDASCVWLEPLVTCADGPTHRVQTPSLFLSAELPDGYAVTSRAPPALLWECAPTPLP